MIEPITLGIGIGTFLFGYIAHSNNYNRSSVKSIETIIEQNKELISLSSTLEILNRDIDRKNSLIAELEGEAAQQQKNINRLLQRADYIRNSGELAQLNELAQTTKNLKLIKENLSKIQNKHVNRFNIGVLVSLVQDMYQDIHNEELDILGVQDLMMDFSDNESESGGDTFGEMDKKPSRPKQTRRTGPGA